MNIIEEYYMKLQWKQDDYNILESLGDFIRINLSSFRVEIILIAL